MRVSTADGRLGSLAIAAGGAAAAVTGLLIVRSPLFGAAAIVALALAVAAMRYGAVGAVIPAFGALPWLVVLEGVIPHATGTFVAGVAAASLLFLLAPLSFRSPLVPVAGAVFIAVVLAQAVYVTDSEQAIQACKYVIFPMMIFAVTSERARELLPALKTPVLASCLAAMVFHLGVIATGHGASSTYYEVGEKLGFAAEGPHGLALMAMIVAAAGLTVKRTSLQVTFFALGAIPVALTGVRSALLGLVVILVIYVIQSPNRWRGLFALATVGAVALAAGGLDVLTTRFIAHPNEFSSFATAGSGRGEIWEIAFEAWEAAGPMAWLFGTGLRSILEFELVSLGTELVGHSDIVEVLVQLGVVGFAAWVALWAGLLRGGLRAIVLLPILAFGIVNGTLEYVAPLAAGLFLAAVCIEPSEDDVLPGSAVEPEEELVERGAGDGRAGALRTPAGGVSAEPRVGMN